MLKVNYRNAEVKFAKECDVYTPVVITQDYKDMPQYKEISSSAKEDLLYKIQVQFENEERYSLIEDYYGHDVINNIYKEEQEDFEKFVKNKRNNSSQFDSITDSFESIDLLTYRNLSKYNNNKDIIIDIGCWSGVQSMFFKDCRFYIGVDNFTNKFLHNKEHGKRSCNSMYFKMDGLKFLKEVLPNMDFGSDNIFIISNLVPDDNLNNYIINNFKNYYVYYPTNNMLYRR